MDKDSNIKNLDTYLSLCTEVYDLKKMLMLFIVAM
jgi:hypothetical protein